MKMRKAAPLLSALKTAESQYGASSIKYNNCIALPSQNILFMVITAKLIALL